MSEKKINLFDLDHPTDTIRKTNIVVKDSDTGETLFEGSNKVIISGSAFTAAKHFNLTPRTRIPNYNTVLGLDHTINETFIPSGVRREEMVFLFAVGIDGCGQEASQVYDVNYTKWIAPENLVPFKYQLATNDIPGHMRDKYFGRKAYNNRIAYYFKAFENQPEFIQQYVDGTPIDENIWTSARLEEVESFVRVNLKITKEDCRDFFLATTGINEARINSISLLTAYEKEVDGYIYYQNIAPLTKLHFPNESLIDTSKGIDIIYDIYY